MSFLFALSRTLYLKIWLPASSSANSLRRTATAFCMLGLFLLGRGSTQQVGKDSDEHTIDVRSAGAVGNGSADDTEAISKATQTCGVKGSILYLPPSQDAYTTTRTINLPAKCTMKIDGALRATAPMEAVVTVGADSTAYRRKIFGTGVIDSGNQARRHISLENYGNFEITGITLLNGASIAGIDVGRGGTKGGYEAYIHDMNLFVPQGILGVQGSVGIWTDKGTDSSVYNITIVGWDVGVRNSVHNNQPFENIHVWGFGPNPGWKNVSNLPSVCFDDLAGDAQWVGDECDTPTRIGLRAHGYNHLITGFSCFNNQIWGTDNVVNCIQFDLPKSYSTVMSSVFQGRSGHRLASDIAVPGDNYATLTILGNQVIGNVVKSRSTWAHLPSLTIDGSFSVGVSGSKQMGCLDGWDHLPCTVAKLSPTILTSTTSTKETTIFTTTTSGVYQVTVTVHGLGEATGGTVTPVAILGNVTASGAAASLAGTGADQVSTASITLEEDAGVAIGYRMEMSGVSGTPRSTVSMEVIRTQ
jgi:hypothetical protein